jgi:hypothetical protein
MNLKTNVSKKAIELIEYVSGDYDAEAGWFIYLNAGYSFDPMANDSCCFIPEDAQQEALTLCTYRLEA